jgi:hypothetical protein
VRGDRGRRGLRRCRQQGHACKRLKLGRKGAARLRFEDAARCGTGRLAHMSEGADDRPAVFVAVSACGQGVAQAGRRISWRRARGGWAQSRSLEGRRPAGVRGPRRNAVGPGRPGGRWAQMRTLPVEPAKTMRDRQLVHRRAEMRNRAHHHDERRGDPDGERTMDGEVTHARTRTRRQRTFQSRHGPLRSAGRLGGCLTQVLAVVKRRPAKARRRRRRSR